MNRLLVGIMLLAIVCIAGSCTDEDEYTQGQWMKKASYNGVYRAYASGFAIGNYGYLCGGFYGANKDYLSVISAPIFSVLGQDKGHQSQSDIV